MSMGILSDNIKVRIPVTSETFRTQHNKLIKMGFICREPYIYYTKNYKTGAGEEKVTLIVSVVGLKFRRSSPNGEYEDSEMTHNNDLEYLMALVEVNDDNLSRCEQRYLERVEQEKELRMYKDMSVFEKIAKLFRR